MPDAFGSFQPPRGIGQGGAPTRIGGGLYGSGFGYSSGTGRGGRKQRWQASGKLPDQSTGGPVNVYENYPGITPTTLQRGGPDRMLNQYQPGGLHWLQPERLGQISNAALALGGFHPASMGGMTEGYGIGSGPLDVLKRLAMARAGAGY